MAVRTPDPDPNERDDDGTPRDPLGGRFGGRDPLGDGSFGSPTPDSAANPGWLSEVGTPGSLQLETGSLPQRPSRSVSVVQGPPNT